MKAVLNFFVNASIEDFIWGVLVAALVVRLIWWIIFDRD